jgi:hypothetical protein
MYWIAAFVGSILFIAVGGLLLLNARVNRDVAAFRKAAERRTQDESEPVSSEIAQG